MIFDKDEENWLVDQPKEGRKGKIIALDFAVGIYESQDDHLKDSSLKYNKVSITERGWSPECHKDAKIFNIAANPTILNENFNEDSIRKSVLNALSMIRETAIDQIDSVINHYLSQNYNKLSINIEEIKLNSFLIKKENKNTY